MVMTGEWSMVSHQIVLLLAFVIYHLPFTIYQFTRTLQLPGLTVRFRFHALLLLFPMRLFERNVFLKLMTQIVQLLLRDMF